MTEDVPTVANGHSEGGGNGFELRDRDKRILELNHQGLSARKISETLKAEGMPLAKSAVYEHLKDMRLIYGDSVQANHHSHKSKEARKNGKWYKVIQWVAEATPRTTASTGFKPMVRTMFYEATDLKIVKEDEYNTFVTMVTDARIGYVDQDGELLLPVLPPDCFADDSRITIDNYDDDEPQYPEEAGEIPDNIEFIDEVIYGAKHAPMDYDGEGEKGEDGRIGGYWYDQPEYVEVWEEKLGLVPGFEKILEDVHLKVRGIKGYSGFSFLYECVEELKKIIDRKGMEPDDVTILYCGDWDPSGENIDYYIKKRLAQQGLAKVNVVRVAVTPEQIDKYHFPLLPVEKKEDKKTPNPNMADFVRRHGYKATHLNAFFTDQNLPIFKEILVDAVNEHWCEDIYEEMEEEYDVPADEPPKLSKEELKEKRRQQIMRMVEKFKPGWEKEHLDALENEE